MKLKALLLFVALITSILAFSGCDNDKETTPDSTNVEESADTAEETDTDNEEEANTDTDEAIDAVTTASIVNKEEDFEKALNKDGTWIIATLNNITINKDLVLEGDFKNDRDEVQRKIALYTQDEERTVTDRFTLTAPKLTIRSPKSSIQHGTFEGDLYVETNDFELVDVTVEGNIYFTSEEAKTGFKMDEDSSVTGKQEVVAQ